MVAFKTNRCLLSHSLHRTRPPIRFRHLAKFCVESLSLSLSISHHLSVCLSHSLSLSLSPSVSRSLAFSLSPRLLSRFLAIFTGFSTPSIFICIYVSLIYFSCICASQLFICKVFIPPLSISSWLLYLLLGYENEVCSPVYVTQNTFIFLSRISSLKLTSTPLLLTRHLSVTMQRSQCKSNLRFTA